jgi:myo-inositol-1(or 4)-monophosphatase
MNDWQINKLIPLLSRCGEIAIHYYNDPAIEIKSDDSVVTIADKKIEQLLGQEFNRPEENVFMIGEETVAEHSAEYLTEALQKTCWIVDPIDGTAPYTNHIDSAWGISVAYMRNGMIEEGAFYCPAINELIITDGDMVWFCDSMLPGQLTLPDLVPFQFKYRQLGTGGMVSISQKMAKLGRLTFADQVLAWSGCVSSMSYLMQGRFPAYIAMLKLWDIAAGLAIIAHGDYYCKTWEGRPLGLNITNGNFNLDFSSSDCWRLQGYAVLASSTTVMDEIFDKIEI